jgi:SAM-dependent methyltransferase
MKELEQYLGQLDKRTVVLDLGCGAGSFHYETCRCRIIAMDVHIRQNNPGASDSKVLYVSADSRSIPLPDNSVDVVVCHHSLEHVVDYKAALSEIARVLAPSGWLWISVPNGYGFDDALYRRIFSGGGHVNRFTYEGLIHDVNEATGLRLIQSCALFSGFVYLKAPTSEELKHFPPTARFLAEVPEGFATAGRIAINAATRIVDRLIKSDYSQYGWAFVFAHDEIGMPQLPSYFNVCRECGSGNAANRVGRRGIRFYECLFCGKVNLFVSPPSHLY